ncbi:hypothetical protein [Ktedonobacter racemifer]|uniref:Lipoprotein n=1 Tax=Ktedonobacter racemifer DSM 44963 TaxID=485913 RepID=D6U748_KTERA|nr:hypothetical protein [Ktedonobacter racemifer]EFH79709.1 hypothetical protein Krac_0201 [Ktedonobacter racemifer DSM 44963]
MNKHIPTLLPALLLAFLVGLSGCGMNAGSQAAGPGPAGSPDSVRINFERPALDPAQSKRVVTLNVATQVQHLYSTIFALPPMPQTIACTADGGFPYTLTFQQGTKTLATVVAADYGCKPVSIAGESTDRQSTNDFWTQLDQAISKATPVARPEQLAILHTLQLDQPPQAAQITSVETVQRLYDAILALPLAPQNGNCSPESLHEYQLVFHTANQAIHSVIDKTCNTISLEGNYQSRSGTFVMNGQFKHLFEQTLAATPFALAHPDRLTLDLQPGSGAARQSTIADAGLRQQLYTKIWALPVGKAQPNCPLGEDKVAGKGKWYTFSFTQWDLPVLMNVDAYEGSCTLVSLDAGQGMGAGQILQGDGEFWDLVHRLENRPAF